MGNSINEFFSSFSNDQRFFLHLPVLWAVTIDGISEGSINSVLSDAGERWNANVSPQSMTKGGNILVAQEVTLPSESSSFTPLESGSSMGGYLPGYGLNVRSNFLDRSFSINFLETEVDIEHNFFRPWMISIGIQGLIAKGPNLKANISVKQYTNGGGLMKGYQFRKAFPTAVEGYTLNYNDTDFKIKSVTFACENYEQI